MDLKHLTRINTIHLIRNRIIVRILVIFFMFYVCLFISRGQEINSLTFVGLDTVTYPSKNEKVPVFVFGDANNNSSILGNLVAYGPVDILEYTFVWEKYNPQTTSFDFIENETATSSRIDDLDDGGYRVIITDGGSLNDTLHALVFCNEMNVAILHKTPEGILEADYRSCRDFSLKGEAFTDSLVYFDVYNNDRYVLVDAIDDIAWTHDHADDQFHEITQKSLSIYDATSLVEDTEFTLTVTNKYNMSRSDQILVVPIRVRAEFISEDESITSWEPNDFYSRYYIDTTTRSAPQTIIFINQSSSKVDSVIWKYNDGFISSSKKERVKHTYLFPGEYNPKLVVSNSQSGCADSIKIEEPIEIESSSSETSFKMPNIFFINGENKFNFSAPDKEMNLFRSYDVSITYIEVVIFSRWGQLVHYYAGDIRLWPGWDGKIKGSNRTVKSGVYYYVIREITGLSENQQTEHFFDKGGKNIRTGFFHVYNSVEY